MLKISSIRQTENDSVIDGARETRLRMGVRAGVNVKGEEERTHVAGKVHFFFGDTGEFGK
jgi:hypothetical protein